jgi:hypothetical protein
VLVFVEVVLEDLLVEEVVVARFWRWTRRGGEFKFVGEAGEMGDALAKLILMAEGYKLDK